MKHYPAPSCRLTLMLMAIALLSPPSRSEEFAAKLKPLIDAHKGQVAVAIKHLGTAEWYGYRADEPMPTASLIKFPVMVEAYRQAAVGNVDLNQLLTLREEDKTTGSGILSSHFSPGTQLSLRDAIRLMIAYSDNTATNLVLDQIGVRATATFMEQLGLPNTKIHAKVFRGDTSAFPDRSKQFGLGSTTAAEMLRLFELLYRRQLVSQAASDAMLDHLLQCDDREKLARLLAPGTKVAHKSGSVATVRCDAGLIFTTGGPIALCVLTSENKDRSWDADNEGNRLCAEIARLAVEHFQTPSRLKPASGTLAVDTVLRVGASGRLVEALQRTLNIRLQPSPELNIDGEFGPITKEALQRFQRAHQLNASGEVDTATLEALGTLITSDVPVPSPDEVNGAELSRKPMDALAGPPFVTCKAWAVADGKSGELLWHDNVDAKLDIASTTKIMTAYLVFRLAQSEPDVLDEEVVFSERADETSGSTAGVRAGERLSVRECLYGLLLRSGNDAAVALAEHFGPRLDPTGNQNDPDSLARFIAEMNRTAKALGMDSTTYQNPHGLTAAGHVGTARDLVRLAHVAWQNELFRDCVAVRERGCTLVGLGGYKRNVVWKNTNRLLEIDGYRGIKTGTTDAAGACLISSAVRGDDELYVVVLGSQSSDARYVDSRNLYRWAWQERGHKE